MTAATVRKINALNKTGCSSENAATFIARIICPSVPQMVISSSITGILSGIIIFNIVIIIFNSSGRHIKIIISIIAKKIIYSPKNMTVLP